MISENMAAAYLDNMLTRSERNKVLKELMHAPGSVLLTMNIAAAAIRAMENAEKEKMSGCENHKKMDKTAKNCVFFKHITKTTD